jgi:hypothetical protein
MLGSARVPPGRIRGRAAGWAVVGRPGSPLRLRENWQALTHDGTNSPTRNRTISRSAASFGERVRHDESLCPEHFIHERVRRRSPHG